MAEKVLRYLKLAFFVSIVYERNGGYFNERIINLLNSFIFGKVECLWIS